jgi:serine/threonine protein kinase
MSTDDTEEGRALLQERVALFWKVMFFVTLLSAAFGALGAIVEPRGLETIVGVAQAAQTGLFWWICARGERSIRFSRAMELTGLLLNLTAGALLGRFVVADFVRGHSFVTAEGTLMTDAYVSLLHVAGYALWLAVRAALVPSSPRYTTAITLLAGVPLVACTALVPTGGGRLGWRLHDATAYPWLPGTAAMIWIFVVVTCVVISWVIYSLRAEIREARRLGQYVLEEKIGEGGMGEVYRARHGMMRRPSALKLIRSDIAGASSLVRFEREVQLTARLTHPNTITIFDYGRTHDGVFYYAMELLGGATLQRIVEVDGPQPPGRVVRILLAACGALKEAHAIGLIHRDIKPANLMLCEHGGEHDVVKLLDFGLVKEVDVGPDEKLTGANTITGTPQYMAPESILDPDSADARADLYALGAVAYFLLSGAHVFDGTSIVEVCSKHIHEKPAPFADRGITVPAKLEAIVFACLEKKPERRPASAAELRQRIEACGVAPWSSEEAEAWWREHRASLEVAREASQSRSPRAITATRTSDPSPASASRSGARTYPSGA